MSYYMSRQGRQSGPFTEEQLKQFLAEGKVLPLDLVWTEGMADWLPLIRVSFTADSPQAQGAIPVSAEVQRGMLRNRTRRLNNQVIFTGILFLVCLAVVMLQTLEIQKIARRIRASSIGGIGFGVVHYNDGSERSGSAGDILQEWRIQRESRGPRLYRGIAIFFAFIFALAFLIIFSNLLGPLGRRKEGDRPSPAK
jgi:hypothetical protein